VCAPRISRCRNEARHASSGKNGAWGGEGAGSYLIVEACSRGFTIAIETSVRDHEGHDGWTKEE
jgi:hypothetical protein